MFYTLKKNKEYELDISEVIELYRGNQAIITVDFEDEVFKLVAVEHAPSPKYAFVSTQGSFWLDGAYSTITFALANRESVKIFKSHAAYAKYLLQFYTK